MCVCVCVYVPSVVSSRLPHHSVTDGEIYNRAPSYVLLFLAISLQIPAWFPVVVVAVYLDKENEKL
jgi:hypothetical protein